MLLVVLVVLIGVAPFLAEPAVRGITYAVLGGAAEMPYAHIKIWHGLVPALYMSIVAVVGGLIVLALFNVSVPLVWDSGPFGILFSLFVVTIAAFNLMLDFDMIERGVQARAPKSLEWYGAFGLMVTIVWMYIEILRLISKSR